ncbi:MAG: response regulator transcription factor [Chryseosolibacter sp.]
MRILIADDHAIVRMGLIELLREDFPALEVFQAENSQQTIDLLKKHTMNLILLDISMPGRNGIDILKHIRDLGIKTPVLMLSMHPEEQYAIRALKAGASGFVNKQSATEELLVAIHKILSGKKYISVSVAEKLAESTDHGAKPAHELLSDREMQVLQKIASGKTVSQIAEEIFLSVNTISTYRTRLLEKLGLKNNAELTRYAMDNGLI